ncbi:MAG: sugar phosphate nucleotidyltransferase [Eubacteriales bacterium]
MNIQKFCIGANCTVLEAMNQLDRAAMQILYITDGARLLAAITDGDIRRWLLSGGDVNAEVEQVANYTPRYLKGGTYEEAVAHMRKHVIESIPIVNESMEIEKVYFLFPKEEKPSKELDIPVVIMAGGEGKRLYPYTNILPKPLIPVGELPILEHIINQFHAYGCNDYYVIVNHKRNMIKAYFGEIEKSYELQFIDEDVPLGTGGGLGLLKDKISETFILSNCDILIEENIANIYKEHKSRHNVVTVVCAQKQVVIPYGIIEASDSGEILAMKEKPELSFLTNTGCYIVEPCVISQMKEGESISFPEVIKRCQHQGDRVGVYTIADDRWLDMGQIEELEKMKRKLQVED